MLTKLMKYDFKYLFTRMTPVYLAGTISTLISFILSKIYQLSSIFEVLFVLSYLTMFFVWILTIALAIIIPILRIYKHIFKAEGYLTNTLPVDVKQIILSKVLSGTIFSMLSYLFTFIMFFTMLVAQSNINDALLTIQIFNIVSVFGIDFTWIIIILIAFISILSFNLYFFTALSIGHSKPGNKIKNSISYGILIYLLNQIFTAIIIIVILALVRFINGYPTIYLNHSTNKIFMIVLVEGLSLIHIFIYYWITRDRLSKHLNIE